MAITKVINDLIDLNATGATKSLKMPSGAAYSGTTQDGMVRNDTDGTSQGSASTMQHFNGTDWKNYENLSSGITVDFLIVAGGGAGAGSFRAGGGGAGGLKTTTTYSGSETVFSASLATAYTIEVGAGGTSTAAQGGNGADSKFGTVGSEIVATGGGGGGYYAANQAGSSGGSGGGSAGLEPSVGSIGAGGAASPAGQGNAGGQGASSSSITGGGGGGGAGAVGNNYGSGATDGDGGVGLQVNIDALNNYYSGGGGGGNYGSVYGNETEGGNGGGGAGGRTTGVDAGVPGSPSTGGGGGGSSFNGVGSSGGSGTVILRYPTASVSSYAVTGTLDTTTDTAYPIANNAYFKFNDDALDSSGNGYNGTAVAGTVTYSDGRFGKAAVFNGSTSSIPLSSSPFTNTQDVSVSLWVKDVVAPSSGYSTIFIGDGNDYFYITVVPSGEIRTYIDNYQDSVYPRTTYQLDTINSNITNGNWHHIVVVSKLGSAASGGGYEIYVDGTLNVSYSYSSTIRRDSGASWTPTFGTYGAGVFPLNGKLDQTRIFTSAISAANVTSLYNESTVIPNTDGTDSILQFIGGTGTVTFS